MGDIRATESLKRGIETAKSGNNLLARLHLLEAVELAPRDPNCWLWLAWVAESPGSAVHSLERVLEEHPDHELARLGLQWATEMAGFDLQEHTAEVTGETENDASPAGDESDESEDAFPQESARTEESENPNDETAATPETKAWGLEAIQDEGTQDEDAAADEQDPAAECESESETEFPCDSESWGVGNEQDEQAVADEASEHHEAEAAIDALEADSAEADAWEVGVREIDDRQDEEAGEFASDDEGLFSSEMADESGEACRDEVANEFSDGSQLGDEDTIGLEEDVSGSSEVGEPAELAEEALNTEDEGVEGEASAENTTPDWLDPEDSFVLEDPSEANDDPQADADPADFAEEHLELDSQNEAAAEIPTPQDEASSERDWWQNDEDEETITAESAGGAPSGEEDREAADADVSPATEPQNNATNPTGNDQEAADDFWSRSAEEPAHAETAGDDEESLIPAESESDPQASESALEETLANADTQDLPPVELPGPDSNVPVLVVDDSPTVRKLVSMTLEKKGYTVGSAADGVVALKTIAEMKPRLILLDITMPRLGGYQLCKLIKKHESTKHIPVIMLSGKDGMFDKVRGKFVGCDDYITKPFDPEELIEKVTTQLTEHKGATATPV